MRHGYLPCSFQWRFESVDVFGLLGDGLLNMVEWLLVTSASRAARKLTTSAALNSKQPTRISLSVVAVSERLHISTIGQF